MSSYESLLDGGQIAHWWRACSEIATEQTGLAEEI